MVFQYRILKLILLCVIIGCQKPPTPASGGSTFDRAAHEEAEKKRSFLLGSSDEEIHQALKYVCEPTKINEEPRPGTFDLKECLKTLPDSFLIPTSFNWDCPQSDRKEIPRPLPDVAAIKTSISFTKASGDYLKAQIHLGDWEKFLKPALRGNTVYNHCRQQAYEELQADVHTKLFQKFRESCGSKVDEAMNKDVMNYVDGLFAYLSLFDKQHETYESQNVLLNPILPFYGDLDLSKSPAFKGPIQNNQLCYPFYESVDAGNHSRRPNPRAVEILDSHFVKETLPVVWTKGSFDCVQNYLKFYLPRNTVDEKCLKNPNQGACPIYRQRLKAMYSTIDSMMKNLSDRTGSFSFLDILRSPDGNGERELIDAIEKSRTVCGPIEDEKSQSVYTMMPSDYNREEYQLTGLANSTTEVSVNVAFSPVCESDEFENKNVAKKWFERANSCLDRFTPYLRGPEVGG